MAVWPAAPLSLSRARGTVRSWLARHGWPRDAADDITLAANEAVANVVDHAYRSATDADVTTAARVHLHAWVSIEPRTRARRVVVTVTDRGRWHTEDGGEPASGNRGHGMVLMSGVMAETHIQRSAEGTTVILVSATESTDPPDEPRAGF